jgi:hypothetical protein
MPESIYTGSCQCGAVRVEVRGGIDSIIHCHCSCCRKASGSAYATNGFVRAEGFRIVQGAEQLRSYASATDRLRYFCGVCGSPIYSSNTVDPTRYRLRLGLLDSPISERPIAHTFVSSRAEWDDLDAALPCYDGYEPSRIQPHQAGAS